MFCLITTFQGVKAQNNTEEINNGFVFIDGKYIEAPYVLDIKDNIIFINDIQITKKISFTSEAFFIRTDPGIPKDVSRFAGLSALDTIRGENGDPHMSLKVRYLHQNYSKKYAIEKIFEYFQNLPYIDNVEEYYGKTLIKLTDYYNKSRIVDISYQEPPTKEKIIESIQYGMENLKKTLKNEECYFFFSDGGEISFSGIKAAVVLPKALKVLEDKTISSIEKKEVLEKLQIVRSKMDWSDIIINNFETKSNLKIRLKNLRRKTSKDIGMDFLESFEKSLLKESKEYEENRGNKKGNSYSPDGHFMYFYYANAWQAPWQTMIASVKNNINEQEPNIYTSFIFKDLTDDDNDPGSCTLTKWIDCKKADILAINSHGTEGIFISIYLADSTEATNWMSGQSNMVVAQETNLNWGPPGATYNPWMVVVKKQWVYDNWSTSLTQSNAIVFVGSCQGNDKSGGTSFLTCCGGGVGFGYPCTVNWNNISPNNISLLKRMNGKLGNGEFRTAEEAYYNMPLPLDNMEIEPSQGAAITLCPATEAFEPSNGEFVQSSGTGYFKVDTYCKDDYSPEEALTFDKSSDEIIIDNIEWDSNNGKANAITFEWEGPEDEYFKVEVTAHADKFISWGWSGGGHQLDGNGESPNGDDVVYTFYYKGDTASLCFILDRSGSMEGAPLANAKAAANQGIYSMDVGDEISVVSFAGTASVDYSVHEILEQNNGNDQKQAAMNAVNSLNAGGWTSIGAGLLAAYNQLLSSNHKTRDYVLLTDGQENEPPWANDILPYFINLKGDTVHHIHTIAFGEGANQQQMAGIADLTGGKYLYCPTRNDPLAIMNVFNTIQNEISGVQTVSQNKNSFTGSQTYEYNVFVDESIFEQRVTLIWDNINQNLTFEMITPDNQVINENNWTGFDGLNFVSGPGIKYFTFTWPELGKWKAKITSNATYGTSDFGLVQTAYSDLKMEVSFDKNLYYRFEPINISADLSKKSNPLFAVTILVEVETPSIKETTVIKKIKKYKEKNKIVSENTLKDIQATCIGMDNKRGKETLLLYDDGKHGDGELNDGVYGNYFRNTAFEGTYSFYISAFGETGTSSFTRTKFNNIYVDSAAYIGQIVMPTGWSGISSSVVPYNSSLENIMVDPINNNNLLVMLSNSGSFIPGQVNQIGNWNSNQGYKVKMNSIEQITLNGTYTSNKTVLLDKGINYLPVLNSEPVLPEEIFNPLGKNFKFAYDIYTGLVYWPTGELYTLETLIPGVAYTTDVHNDCEVTFPYYKANTGYISFDRPSPPIIKNAPLTVVNTGIPHIISIKDSALRDLQIGDIILAFTKDSLCAGISQYAGHPGNLPLIVFGNDTTTSIVDGFITDESINIEIYRPISNTFFPVKVIYDHGMPNSYLFEEYGLSAITRIDVGEYTSNDFLKDAITVFPNPNTGKFNIYFNGIEGTVKFHILNVAGQIVKRGIMYVNDQSNKIIDLSKNSKGIYFIEFKMEEFSKFKKIIVK